MPKNLVLVSVLVNTRHLMEVLEALRPVCAYPDDSQHWGCGIRVESAPGEVDHTGYPTSLDELSGVINPAPVVQLPDFPELANLTPDEEIECHIPDCALCAGSYRLARRPQAA